jgi:hypothetical protein
MNPTEIYAPKPYGSNAPYNPGAAVSYIEAVSNNYVLPPTPTNDFYPRDEFMVIENTGGGKVMASKEVYVEDTDTGKPLANANVYVKDNPKIGGVTNAQGIVNISAPSDNSIIVFSHVGYATRERKFGDLGSLQNLDKEVQQLNTASVGGGVTKKNWYWIPLGIAAIWGISTLVSGGSTGKTGLNGPKKRKET